MKNIIAIVAAVFLGIVAVAAVSSYVEGIRSAQAGQMMKAAAVRKTIAKGETVKRDDLESKEIKIDEDAIAWADAKKVVGLTAATEIKAGQTLTFALFSAEESAFSKKIPSGKRAITLTVGSDSGFAGMLVPGDIIDILITYNPSSAMSQAFAGTSRPLNSGGAAANETTGIVTTFMMTGIQIVALDNRTKGEIFNATGSDYNAKSYGSVTVTLKPDEAQLIVFAQQCAGVKMTYLLRNPEDRAPLEGVSAMDYKWFTRMLEQSSGEH